MTVDKAIKYDKYGRIDSKKIKNIKYKVRLDDLGKELIKRIERPKRMAGRISLVEKAFRQVNRTFVRNIPKQFDVIFNRKAKFLEGNLIGSFERAEIVGISRVLAEANKGYGAKIALMELQAKRGIR